MHAGRAHDGAAAADSRRCGLRRPGRGRGMLRPLGPEGPPHRRLDPFHRQQPDRLHHLSALLALLALSVRRREDDRGADLPRQRRRSGSGGVRRQDRDRVPPELPQAGRDRHVLLSPLRPQRGRRAGLHPAADVQEDPRASVDAGDLREEARRRRRVTEGEVDKMQGRLARALDAEFEAGQATSPTRPTGSTAAGPASRPPIGRRRSAPRRHRRRPRRCCKEIGEKITTVPDGFHVHKTIQRFLDNRRKAIETGAGHRLGDRRGARLRHAAAWTATAFACPARMSSAARSRSATPC